MPFALHLCSGQAHRTVKIWSRLGKDVEKVDSWTTHYPFFLGLKESSLKQLEANTQLRSLSPTRTCMVLSILGMWKYIIKYHLHNDEEVKVLLQCVVKILDEEDQHDRGKLESTASIRLTHAGSANKRAKSRVTNLAPELEHELHEDNAGAVEGEIVLMQCMEACLNIMNELMDQRVEQAVYGILEEFRKRMMAQSLLEVMSSDSEVKMDEHMQAFADDIVFPMMAQLEGAKYDGGPDGDAQSVDPFSYMQATLQTNRIPQLLLGLTLHDYEPLVNLALTLILKMSSLQNQASNLLFEQYLLYTETSEAVWMDACRQAANFREALETSGSSDDQDHCVRHYVRWFVKLVCTSADILNVDAEFESESEEEEEPWTGRKFDLPVVQPRLLKRRSGEGSKEDQRRSIEGGEDADKAQMEEDSESEEEDMPQLPEPEEKEMSYITNVVEYQLQDLRSLKSIANMSRSGEVDVLPILKKKDRGGMRCTTTRVAAGAGPPVPRIDEFVV